MTLHLERGGKQRPMDVAEIRRISVAGYGDRFWVLHGSKKQLVGAGFRAAADFPRPGRFHSEMRPTLHTGWALDQWSTERWRLTLWHASDREEALCRMLIGAQGLSDSTLALAFSVAPPEVEP